MNLLEALQAVYEDRSKMARPVVNEPARPAFDAGIYFDKLYGWLWSGTERKAGLPAPAVLFGEWRLVDLVRDPKYNPDYTAYPTLREWLDRAGGGDG